MHVCLSPHRICVSLVMLILTSCAAAIGEGDDASPDAGDPLTFELVFDQAIDLDAHAEDVTDENTDVLDEQVAPDLSHHELGHDQSVDVDECQDLVVCGVGHCVNEVDGYYCECPDYYYFDGVTCSDIDECADSDLCGVGDCVNEVGMDYLCGCPDYYYDDGQTCSDIDECEDADICGVGACANEVGTGYSCDCPDIYWDNGETCVCRTDCSPTSCKEIMDMNPDSMLSGVYEIDPTGTEPFDVYCEMVEMGGGWTLVFNQNTSFDASDLGSTVNLAYGRNGINRAYSTVPIESDLMFDVANTDIVDENWVTRTVVENIEDGSGFTLHYLLNTVGNWRMEAPDNSNVTNSLTLANCHDTNWGDYESNICDSDFVMTLHDTTEQSVGPFLIGSERSDGTPRTNQTGWPNAIGAHYPSNFRIWVR